MEQELINALEQGATVVTANQRLARHLAGRYAAVQRGKGLGVWETPDVLPWAAWLARSWASWFDAVSERDTPPARLLTSEQEQVLWEAVVQTCEGDDPLFDVQAAARLAREAWGLWCVWRLPLKAGGRTYASDTDAFLKWAAAFKSRCRAERVLDSARVGDAVADGFFARRLTMPWRLLLAGFDELTPQQNAVLGVLRKQDCDVVVVDSTGCPPARAGRVGVNAVEQELTLAAGWARARLEEDPGCRIAIVIPDLAELRDRIARIFDDVFHPEAVLPDSIDVNRAYNVSLGRPLTEYPVVHTALNVLELWRDPISLTQVGNLLRSPFVGQAESEASRRALLDARLRKFGEPEIGWRRLLRFARARDENGNPRHDACPRFARMLTGFTRLLQALPRRQSPAAWAQAFARLLATFGWPGERGLTSEEYQAVEAWGRALRALAGLERVAPQLGLNEALTRVRQIAEGVFQPESSDAPVQVMGMLEASGASFDYLWLMGMHDEAWPAAARPNPLLPVALQRAYGVPHASAQRELEYARRVTERLLHSAREIVASYPRREGDRDLYPSPLITGLAEVQQDQLSVYDGEPWTVAIHRSADLEELLDDRGPALETDQVAGGSFLLQDQAACPFRAFAAHRLGARAVEEPALGLDARARGSLVHDALEHLWMELKTQRGLCERTADELRATVKQAVSRAIDEVCRRRGRSPAERFFSIERARLGRLLRDWLELERQRAPFEVVALEQDQILHVGGLRLHTRADRIDRLTDGGRVIIDYKTGQPDAPAWFDQRPEQPQLPLYGVYGHERERPAAVLLAHVRQSDMTYKGIVAHEGLVPGLEPFLSTEAGKDYDSWDAVFESWKRAMTALAAEVRTGRADVAPKRYPDTCKYCALPGLCRVNERFDAPPHGAPAEDQDA